MTPNKIVAKLVIFSLVSSGQMVDFAALQTGTVLAGRYRIERLLKSGGMGAVYVARHTRTNAALAVKVMRPEIVSDATMRQRFAQEAQVSARIESVHIVNVTDADVDEATGMPFLVMELLRGEELGERVQQRGPLALAETVQYIAQTAKALDKAHASGIVHRDLKPENLFLATSDDEPPKIKILDFGIAKILQSTTHAASTQGGGTPLYMAPEQTRRGREIGPWTDIWALGLIAYTLLVGSPYWEAETIGELYGELLAPHHEAASVRAERRGRALPTGFDSWFAKCVNSDPHQRFGRAGEAAAALALLASNASTTAEEPPTSSATVATASAVSTVMMTSPPLPAGAATTPTDRLDDARARSNRRSMVVALAALVLIGGVAALAMKGNAGGNGGSAVGEMPAASPSISPAPEPAAPTFSASLEPPAVLVPSASAPPTSAPASASLGSALPASASSTLKKPTKLVEAGTDVQGRLPPEVIKRIIRANFGRFRACYEQGLKKDPTLKGSVSVRFVIGTDGAVESASLLPGSMPDGQVSSCVLGVYRTLSFPEPEGGKVIVTYPIDFQNAD